MGDSVSAMATSPEMRRAHQVNYSVLLLSSIAQEYDATVDAANLGTAAAAMVEAFWVHIRLLSEFLLRRPPRDIVPADFGVDWVAQASHETQRLGEYWDVASKHVVHYGHARVPADLSDLSVFAVSGEVFVRMALDALTVYSQFLAQLLLAFPPVPATEPIPDRQRDSDQWQQRLLADRSALMKDEFLKACARLGQDGRTLLGV